MKLAFHVTTAACVLALAGIAAADSIEQFDFLFPPSDGTLIQGSGSGTGWSGNWSSSNWTFQSAGLTHPSLEGEAGGRAQSPNGTSGNSARVTDVVYSSGTVYLSFLMRQTSPTGDPYTGIDLRSNDGGNLGSYGRVFSVGALRGDDGVAAVGGESNGFYFVDSQALNNAASDTAEAVFAGTFNTDVNLFVIRFNLDGDKTANVFFNPTSTAEVSSGDGLGTIDLVDNFNFNQVYLRNAANSGNVTSIDEIRISTVAPVITPEPSSVGLLGAALATVMLRRRKSMRG